MQQQFRLLQIGKRTFEVLSSETARKLLEAGDNNFENGDLEKALEDWEASFRLDNADIFVLLREIETNN